MELDTGIVLKLVVGLGASLIGGITALVALLLIFMAIDIFSGVIAGVKAKAISSDVSYPGARKKAMIVLLVGMGAAIDYYTPLGPESGISAMDGIAGFFVLHEGISILENAGRAGVPYPPWLKDILTKLAPSPQIPSAKPEGT